MKSAKWLLSAWLKNKVAFMEPEDANLSPERYQVQVTEEYTDSIEIRVVDNKYGSLSRERITYYTFKVTEHRS